MIENASALLLWRCCRGVCWQLEADCCIISSAVDLAVSYGAVDDDTEDDVAIDDAAVYNNRGVISLQMPMRSCCDDVVDVFVGSRRLIVVSFFCSSAVDLAVSYGAFDDAAV